MSVEIPNQIIYSENYSQAYNIVYYLLGQLITCLFKLKWNWVIVLISNLPYLYQFYHTIYLNFLWQRFRHIWNLSKFIYTA